MTPQPLDAPWRALPYARSSSAKQKSIDEQTDENRAACARDGWTIVDELSDGTSASRYRTKVRANWTQLLTRLPDVDVVVLWEPSRGDRELGPWIAFLDLCRKHGVKIHATGHGTTYDPRNARHYRSLAEDGVDSAYETDKMSLRLLRGFVGQAESGRPHSHTTYGYERIYSEHTRQFLEQRPHPEHAEIVREIVRRAGKSDPLLAIARDLTARGVPTPQRAARWSSQTVRAIALNRAYVGVRVHAVKRDRAKQTEHAATWPALVTEAEHYAAVRVLGDPARRKYRGPRPGKASSLLGSIATCGNCAGKMSSKIIGGPVYACHYNVDIEALDELVTEVVLARLADPSVYEQLRQANETDDRTIVEARSEVDRLTAELNDWRDSAARGETTPASLARVESGLSARIADALARAKSASIPVALRALVGPGVDVRARWSAASLGAKRDIIKSLLNITLHGLRGTPGGPRRELIERVTLEWRTS